MMAKKVQVNFDNAALEVIDRLKRATGSTAGDVIRDALNLYGWAQQETTKGRTIATSKHGRVVREVILPFELRGPLQHSTPTKSVSEQPPVEAKEETASEKAKRLFTTLSEMFDEETAREKAKRLFTELSEIISSGQSGDVVTLDEDLSSNLAIHPQSVKKSESRIEELGNPEPFEKK